MPEPKAACTKCGAEILQVTASITGGLCMPCKNDWPPRPDPPLAFEVSCSVRGYRTSRVTFYASAQDLLEVLDQTRHFGDSSHPNKFELEAQRALLRHVVRHRVDGFALHDDHWGRTSSVLERLFEQNKAYMEADGKRFTFAELTKEEWSDVTAPLAGEGGFLYRDARGTVIFKQMTWVS